MRSTVLLTLVIGGCAGLTLAALSLQTSQRQSAAPGPGSVDLGEPNPARIDSSDPAPAVPPLPPSAESRKPATLRSDRVALGGFLRKVVWEPDRDEPIRQATVRVVLATPAGTEEEIGRCVTDERGAFNFEADLSYGMLPAALRLKPEKEGWADAWSVPGLPLAIDALPHASTDLVWHMTRARAMDGSAVPRADTGGAAAPRPNACPLEAAHDLDASTQPVTWRSHPHGKSRADTRSVRPAGPR